MALIKKIFAAIFLLVVALWCLAGGDHPVKAQFNNCGSGFCNNTAGAAGCTPQLAATTFITRTSGLSATETTAFCNLINGLVTDGVITGNLSGASGCGSVLDGMYVFATSSRANANLNICGTAFTATQNGTNVQCAFTADAGYTGDGANCWFSTGYNPTSAALNWGTNNASIGACILTSGTPSGTFVFMGGNAGGNDNSIAYVSAAPTFGGDLNDTGFPAGPSISNEQGSWLITRAASGNTTLTYYGPSGSSTPLGTSSKTTTTLTNFNMAVLAWDSNGSIVDFSPLQLAYVYWGGSITGAQYASIFSRFHTFLTSLGSPSGC